MYLCPSSEFWRRANARNVSFLNSLRWPIYNFNLVDKTNSLVTEQMHGYMESLCQLVELAKSINCFNVDLLMWLNQVTMVKLNWLKMPQLSV